MSNVTWNAPAPVPVPTYNVVNTGTQAAEAISQAPVNAAKNAASVAQNNAETSLAPLAVDAEKQQMQAAAMKADDATLARIGPAVASNPKLLESPVLQGVLGPLLGRRGIEIPRDAAGGIDHAALAGIVNPQKPFSAWTQDDVNKALAAPPEARKLPADAPDWLKTAPVRTPMSQVGLNQTFTGLASKEKLLSDAKSGYTPAQFLADVKQTQARLKAAGNYGEADSLNEYLSPDGTSLNDAFKERHVGEQYASEIQKIHDLGIHLTNEDQYKQEREKDLRNQFDRTLSFKYSDLQGKEKIAYVKAQQTQTRLDDDQQRLHGYLDSIDLQKKKFTASGQQSDFRIYKGLLSAASSQFDSAHRQLDGVTAQINNISQNPKLRNSPLYKSLIDQAASLNSFLQTQGPILRAEQYDASQSIVRSYSAITGTAASGPTAGSAAPYATDPKGRPMRPNAANTGWEYFDGTPVEGSK